MKLSEHKDLKKEILSLPIKEKDKLLLRLVAKDKVLTEHLHFLLLEDERNLNDRVALIKNQIETQVEILETTPKTTAKETLIVLRSLTKQINHFYKVTKADFEELELKIQLFNAVPLNFRYKVYSVTKNHEQLLAYYMVKAVIILLKKFYKLHEDLQFDLKNQMNELLAKIYNSYLERTAKDLALPIHID